MKRFTYALVASFVLLGVGICYAVEPTYKGPMGNAEEPALRPYKWMVRGAKALVYQTGKSFQRGNMKTPVLGTVDVGRGLRRGLVEAGESVFKGAIGSPPPLVKGEYKKTGKANEVIEEDMVFRNAADGLVSGVWFWAGQKVHDRHSMETDEQVDIRLARAKETREARAETRLARDVEEGTAVERAQRHYVPGRTERRTTLNREARGNLLRKAK